MRIWRLLSPCLALCFCWLVKDYNLTASDLDLRPQQNTNRKSYPASQTPVSFMTFDTYWLWLGYAAIAHILVLFLISFCFAYDLMIVIPYSDAWFDSRRLGSVWEIPRSFLCQTRQVRIWAASIADVRAGCKFHRISQKPCTPKLHTTV